MSTVRKRVSVVVSRKWKNPDITIEVTSGEDGGIAISMPLDQFLESLAEEIHPPIVVRNDSTLLERVKAAMSPPALIPTKGWLAGQLQASSQVVVDEMKNATARVV